MYNLTRCGILFIAAMLLMSVTASAQKTVKPKPKNNVIFAVLSDGRMIEPLAKIENGKLMQTVSGGDADDILGAFGKLYYKPKTVYNLIFGGKVAGTVSVIKNDPTKECISNMATVSTKTTRTKLKGFVMGLATDVKLTKPASGVRRMPTAAERTEIEKLVVAEFAKNKVTAKPLRSHNLTALDIDGDGKIEFVGSYWVATSKTERAKMFFIADRVRGDKYSLGLVNFDSVEQENVMNEEISSVDEGVYHELLLDVLDYNNDGVSEIFSYVQAFEGAAFNVYQRNEGTWERVLEASNYHCGY